MIAKLPGWVVDDETSVREEVADLRTKSPSELWRLAILCSRDAIWAVRAGGRRDEVLAREDPLPESTVAALARLRAQMPPRHGRR
jgi:hypothetical protein